MLCIQSLNTSCTQVIASLSAAIEQFPALKKTPEHWALVKDVAWWVDEQSQALMDHISGGSSRGRSKPASAGIINASSVAGNSAGGCDWRSVARAEVRLMLSMCLPGMAHPSVVERLRRVAA